MVEMGTENIVAGLKLKAKHGIEIRFSVCIHVPNTTQVLRNMAAGDKINSKYISCMDHTDYYKVPTEVESDLFVLTYFTC
jgi:hypothetical protein